MSTLRQRRWWRTCGAAMAAATAVATTGLIVPAGADEEAATSPDTYYIADVMGHPVEPYAELPEELTGGVPGTYIELQKAPLPVRCESISAIYDPSLVADGVAVVLSDGKYQNPTKAWAVNPPDSRPSKAEIGPVPNGPQSRAECTSPTEGVGSATFGRLVNDSLSVESSSSDSSNKLVAGENLVITETTNVLQGIKVGELSISSLESWLKVEWRPGKEPVASYRIVLDGIRNGSDWITSGGEKGIVLSGRNIAGPDLAKQFNEQVKSNEPAFEQLGKYGLRLFEPRFYVHPKVGRYVIEVSALDAVAGLAARRNQGIGHGFGFRLAASRAMGKFGFYGSD